MINKLTNLTIFKLKMENILFVKTSFLNLFNNELWMELE